MSQAGGFDRSYKAGADLNTTTTDWQPVRVNSSNSVMVANSITHRPIGIIQNRPKSGTGASCWVRSVGYSKLTMNDTCSAGDLVIMGANGPIRGTALSITVATNQSTVGRAVEASIDTGSVIEVLIQQYNLAGSLTVVYD